MDLSFVETMRGTLAPPDGRPRPADFQIRTRSEGGGRFRFEGVVHAPPWVDEAPCTGTLIMGLAPPSITYEVHFEAADGGPLVLAGAKSPQLLRPVGSMSNLTMTLSDRAGAQKAQGSFRFSLGDLPAFLLSWVPVESRQHRRFWARYLAVSRRELVGG